MVSTYSGDPAASDKDKLRFYVGDTDSEDFILTDAELEFILAETASFERAVIETLIRIVHRLNNEVSTALGPSRIEAQQRYDHYYALLQRAENSARLNKVSIFAGGIDISDKEAREQNNDRVEPYFRRAFGQWHAKPRP